MQVHFLSDGSDFRSRSGGGYLAKNRRSNGLFWWTILITLLLGMAVFCWFFSIMVFKYPEKPLYYRLLSKLDRLEPVKQFSPITVPHGSFLSAKELLTQAQVYLFSTEKLRVTNDTLKRNFILNYVDDGPVYVKGTFTMVQSRPLVANDLFSSGWVVRAKSVDLEDVQVELLLPADPSKPSKKPPYKQGEAFTLDNKSTFGAVLHVERIQNDGICATLVPIVYGDYAVGGDQRIALAPPPKLNVEAQFPVMQQVDDTVAAESTASKVAKTSTGGR